MHKNTRTSLRYPLGCKLQCYCSPLSSKNVHAHTRAAAGRLLGVPPHLRMRLRFCAMLRVHNMKQKPSAAYPNYAELNCVTAGFAAPGTHTQQYCRLTAALVASFAKENPFRFLDFLHAACVPNRWTIACTTNTLLLSLFLLTTFFPVSSSTPRLQLDSHTRALVENYGRLLRSAKITNQQNAAREDLQVRV